MLVLLTNTLLTVILVQDMSMVTKTLKTKLFWVQFTLQRKELLSEEEQLVQDLELLDILPHPPMSMLTHQVSLHPILNIITMVIELDMLM